MTTFFIISVRCACQVRHTGPHDYSSFTIRRPDDAARCPMVLTIPLVALIDDQLMRATVASLREQGRRVFWGPSDAILAAAADGAALHVLERDFGAVT